MTPTQEQDMITAIKTRMTAIIATYQQARPDIKILISGYDFPRFTADNQIQAYREAYLNMGSPTPLELNSALIRYSQAMAGLADQKSVFYIQHLGLMHYFYGNTADGLAPLTTAAPDLISPINNPTQTGGSPSHLTDPTAMLNAGGQVDAFHLSSTGFGKLADHSVSIYLKTWLQ